MSEVRMIDVGEKNITRRRAVACGEIRMNATTAERIRTGQIPKGNVLAAAQLSGIMAAKRTSEWLPLCHPLPLEGVDVRCAIHDVSVEVSAEVRCSGKTGVEMEALTAVSAACLTIYDMCKSLDPAMIIGSIRLMEKGGGRSGHFVRQEASAS